MALKVSSYLDSLQMHMGVLVLLDRTEALARSRVCQGKFCVESIGLLNSVKA